jgi:hypothetical protein
MTILATIVAALAMHFAFSILPSDALAFAVVTVVSTVISEEPLIYRNGISPLLKEKLGIELGKSTIAKLFSPAVGQGCEPACYWNKRPLYEHLSKHRYHRSTDQRSGRRPRCAVSAVRAVQIASGPAS